MMSEPAHRTRVVAGRIDTYNLSTIGTISFAPLFPGNELFLRNQQRVAPIGHYGNVCMCAKRPSSLPFPADEYGDDDLRGSEFYWHNPIQEHRIMGIGGLGKPQRDNHRSSRRGRKNRSGDGSREIASHSSDHSDLTSFIKDLLKGKSMSDAQSKQFSVSDGVERQSSSNTGDTADKNIARAHDAEGGSPAEEDPLRDTDRSAGANAGSVQTDSVVDGSQATNEEFHLDQGEMLTHKASGNGDTMPNLVDDGQDAAQDDAILQIDDSVDDGFFARYRSAKTESFAESMGSASDSEKAGNFGAGSSAIYESPIDAESTRIASEGDRGLQTNNSEKDVEVVIDDADKMSEVNGATSGMRAWQSPSRPLARKMLDSSPGAAPSNSGESLASSSDLDSDGFSRFIDFARNGKISGNHGGSAQRGPSNPGAARVSPSVQRRSPSRKQKQPFRRGGRVRNGLQEELDRVQLRPRDLLDIARKDKNPPSMGQRRSSNGRFGRSNRVDAMPDEDSESALNSSEAVSRLAGSEADDNDIGGVGLFGETREVGNNVQEEMRPSHRRDNSRKVERRTRLRRVLDPPVEWNPMTEAEIMRLKSDSTPLSPNYAELNRGSVDDCSDCRGSGLTDCVVCEGEGWVERPPADAEEYEKLPYAVREIWERPELVIDMGGRAQCPPCHGTGKAFCPVCEGSGSDLVKGFDLKEGAFVFDLVPQEAYQAQEWFEPWTEAGDDATAGDELAEDQYDDEGEDGEDDDYRVYEGDVGDIQNEFGIFNENLVDRDEEDDDDDEDDEDVEDDGLDVVNDIASEGPGRVSNDETGASDMEIEVDELVPSDDDLLLEDEDEPEDDDDEDDDDEDDVPIETELDDSGDQLEEDD